MLNRTDVLRIDDNGNLSLDQKMAFISIHVSSKALEVNASITPGRISFNFSANSSQTLACALMPS